VSTAENAHAVRLLLAALGLSVEDLNHTGAATPTIAEYLPRVVDASGPGALRTYSGYWARITAVLGERRLDEVTATDLETLIQQAVRERARRRSDRGAPARASTWCAPRRRSTAGRWPTTSSPPPATRPHACVSHHDQTPRAAR
jgi:hypothetical protein